MLIKAQVSEIEEALGEDFSCYSTRPYFYVHGLIRHFYKYDYKNSKELAIYLWNKGFKDFINTEDFHVFLKQPKKHNYPWYHEMAASMIEEMGIDGFHKHIWKTYKKRKCYELDDFGDYVHKHFLHTYTALTTYGGYVQKRTTSKTYSKNTISGYWIEDDIDRHLLTVQYTDNGSYTLMNIIQGDYQICDEHPDQWFLEICPKCEEKYKLYSYSENPLNHLKAFQGKERVYLGVELEVDTNLSKMKDVYKSMQDFIICKRDGSIRGFEVVTAPASFDVHREKFSSFPWEDQVISKKDGMHVHIDRKSLSELQIGKMFEFVYNPDNFLLLDFISGRELDNYFCSNRTRKHLLSDLVEDGERLSRKYFDKYTALNVTNKGTLEVRIFQAPKTYEEFMSNLEFVKALIYFTAPCNVHYKHAKEKDAFLSSVDRHNYPYLHKTLKAYKEAQSCA